MAKNNSKEGYLKKLWIELKKHPLYELTQAIAFCIGLLFGDSLGLIDLLDMNEIQLLLIFVLIGVIILLNYFHRKMVRDEISNAVDKRFEDVSTRLKKLEDYKVQASNNHVIQRKINNDIATALKEDMPELYAYVWNDNHDSLKSFIEDRNQNQFSGNEIERIIRDFKYEPEKFQKPIIK